MEIIEFLSALGLLGEQPDLETKVINVERGDYNNEFTLKFLPNGKLFSLSVDAKLKVSEVDELENQYQLIVKEQETAAQNQNYELAAKKRDEARAIRKRIAGLVAPKGDGKAPQILDQRSDPSYKRSLDEYIKEQINREEDKGRGEKWTNERKPYTLGD